MKDIYGIKKEELATYFENLGYKSYKATQVYEWLYEKRVKSFDEMTNIKKEVIELLKKDFYFGKLKISKKQENKTTAKYLFELEDGNKVEAVLMKHDYGNSVCVSSQIGCNIGCSFCESGRLKKVRNLTAGEMVKEVLMVEEEYGKRIDSVVIMGIGEPFDNYDNVTSFMKIINDPKGIHLGARHITVSTSGIVPKIKEFASFPLQINLAISLHAPNNEIRDKIMKINKVYKIEELIDAIKYYIEKTNRRVTIEYILLKDVNDSNKCAHELVDLLRGLNVYVNLIPYNETSNIEYKESNEKRKKEFYDIIRNSGIVVTTRKKFGEGIDAACGQLRASEVKE